MTVYRDDTVEVTCERCGQHYDPDLSDAADPYLVCGRACAQRPSCPLCGHGPSRLGWLRPTRHAGQTYTYRRCLQCASLWCDPTPDAATRIAMYGADYAALPADPTLTDPRDTDPVLTVARRRRCGCAVDYGCGDGRLVRQLADLGWRAFGVEVAAADRDMLYTPSVFEELFLAESVRWIDLLHVGDVLEHLVAPVQMLSRYRASMRAGALLVAQGPLEAQASLFTSAVRLTRHVTPHREATQPPYHVTLATARGQRVAFRRAGFRELEWTTTDVAWPAPSRCPERPWRTPRLTALWATRRLSTALPHAAGNRYWYVGTVD